MLPHRLSLEDRERETPEAVDPDFSAESPIQPARLPIPRTGCDGRADGGRAGWPIRIQSLRGTLTDDVKVRPRHSSAKLIRGGTFNVEAPRTWRPAKWQITETHVHIGGHALLFKTIGQQEDEVKTDWQLSTAPDLQHSIGAAAEAKPGDLRRTQSGIALQRKFASRRSTHGTLKRRADSLQVHPAAAAVILMPCVVVGAQISTSTPTPAVTGQLPVASPQASPLPLAPSSLLAGQDTGLVRPAGSGYRFVAPSTTPGPGGFPVEKPVDGPLPLTLDDAVSIGLQRNLRLKFERANQRTVRGYRGQIANAILPDLQFKASSSAQELNLEALGFNPSKVGPLLTLFGIDPSQLQTIVKIQTTSAQISLDQQIINLPDFELYRAIKPEFRSVDLNVQDSNEQLVQAVTTAYLKVLADQANLDNAIAQEESGRVLLDQATQRDQAGIGIRLDVLRAQVQYQQEQQQHVSADAQLDKDGIQLNRVNGTAGRPGTRFFPMTRPTPNWGALTLDQARDTALSHRSDLLGLQQSIVVASHESKAVKYQRLPTVAVNGFYGILGGDHRFVPRRLHRGRQPEVPCFQ